MMPENNLLFFLLLIFIFLLIHYSFFLIRVYSGFRKLGPEKNENNLSEFVSVIIPFRNEEENILANLKSIEAQDYPKDKFEVIYIDDSSGDNSVDVILNNKTAPNIKVISVPQCYSPSAHKKRAIRYGIENSKGEIIVTSDADCRCKPAWLKSLISNLDLNTGFVSGPVEFLEEESFFSKIQKIEFAGLVLTGAGLIGSGSPTICNAANIAYRKKIFDLVGGFNEHLKLSSGDDELLMQKIAKDTNFRVKFSLNQESIVFTSSNKNFKDFYQQRKRWASKGLFYRDKSLVIKLLLIYFFYLGLPVQLTLSILFHGFFLISFSASILFKAYFEFRILMEGKKKLFPDLPLNLFLISELFHIPYIIFAGMAGAFGNYTWKQRIIKR